MATPTQYVQYPSSSASTVTSNQGTANTAANGWPVKPTDGVNSQSFTATGAAKVDGSAVTQPVSGTVTANAGTGNFTVTQATGTNLHTVIDSGTVTANVGTTNGLALDATVSQVQGSTGAAVPTKANLIAGTDGVNLRGISVTNAGKLNIEGGNATALKVDGSAVTQPVSGTITANVGTTNGLALDTTVSAIQGSATGGAAATKSDLVGGQYNTALPTLTNGQQAAVQLDSSGRAIIAPLTNSSVLKAQLQDNAGTAVVLGQTTMSASLPVAIASNQSTLGTDQKGKSSVELIRNDYTITSVTTAAYVQLIASTASTINRLDIFDSSGQTLVFAVGGVGTEVNQFYIYPGGNGSIDLNIALGSRLSVKAISATASTGELDINCFS